MESCKLKKILVLGESNSVMTDGWVSGFVNANSTFLEVVNWSIGSTGLINALYRLCTCPQIKDFDAVIIETCINDSTFFRADLDRHYYLLNSIINWLCNNGLFVSILRFQRRSLRESDAEALWRQVLEIICKYRLHYYDSGSYFKSRADELRVPVADLYTDSAHPSRKMSFNMGLDYSDAFVGSFKNFTRPSSNYSSASFNFYSITTKEISEDLQALNIIKRQNRLGEFLAFQVTKDAFSIRLPEISGSYELVGILFNAANSLGSLEIISDFGSCAKSLTNPYSPIEHAKFLLWGRPFHNPINIGEKITLRTLRNSQTHEPTEYCMPRQELSELEPIVEVVAIILSFSHKLVTELTCPL